RVFRKRLHCLIDEAFELPIRHGAVDQSHIERLLSIIPPPQKHEFTSARMADRLKQTLMAFDVVADAKLCGRNGELGRRAAVTQIAGQRELEPAAEAEAMDHCDRRLRCSLDRIQDLIEKA